MDDFEYLMENDEETFRLERKNGPLGSPGTSPLGAGKTGDARCRPGVRLRQDNVHPSRACPTRRSRNRCGHLGRENEFARSHYAADGIDFIRKDIRFPLDGLGSFDLVWIRFVLEYYRSNAFDIVRNVSQILKPGGILCLIDLDLNCMNHFGLSERLRGPSSPAARGGREPQFRSLCREKALFLSLRSGVWGYRCLGARPQRNLRRMRQRGCLQLDEEDRGNEQEIRLRV